MHSYPDMYYAPTENDPDLYMANKLRSLENEVTYLRSRGRAKVSFRSKIFISVVLTDTPLEDLVSA